jgi:hypothetical protein
MRFQMLQDWPISQFCISAGTFLNLDKPEAQMTQCERWAENRTPPLNAILALDWECAWVMHEAYPEFRHRLRRQLGPLHQEIFGRLERGELTILTREQVKLARNLEAMLQKKERTVKWRAKQAAEFDQRT